MPGHTSPVADARQRVSAFVDALNGNAIDRANGFLCSSMRGRYGPDSLDGIVPGSLGVAGVTVDGDTGTAIVAYRASDGGIEHAQFTLRTERDRWMLCPAR